MRIIESLFNNYDFPGKFIYLMALPAKKHKDDEPAAITRHINDKKGLELFLKAYKSTHNLYFGVNPRRNNSKTMSSVECVHCLWVDIDNVTEPPQFILPPTAVVSSGNGFHMYWKLDECVTDFDDTTMIIRRLEKTLGADSTSDPTRTLRIDDSYNFKPRDKDNGDYETVTKDVIMLEDNPYKYTINDLANACNNFVKHLPELLQGSLGKNKSRSERDYEIVKHLVKGLLSDLAIHNIFEYYPCGDRHREREDYLSRTIAKVRDKVNIANDTLEAISGAVEGIFEASGCYWKTVQPKKSSEGDGIDAKKLSNFVVRPKFLVLDSEDYTADQLLMSDIVNDDLFYEDVRIPREAFHSNRQFKASLSHFHWVWYGNDADVINLNMYLITQLPENSIKEIVRKLGYHENIWLGAEYSYVAKEWVSTDSTNYIYQNAQNHLSTIKYFTGPMLNEREYLQETIHHLVGINDASKIFPILGWFCATLFKSRLSGSFPILNLHGTRGSGKTQTIMILQRLACYDRPHTFDCLTTSFTLLTLLSASTDILVSLSEYREGDPKITQSLNRMLLLAYDGSVATRGKKDQSVTEYRLTSPITLDGEDAASDPAILERCLQIALSKNDLDGPRVEHFNALQRLDLSVLGTRLIEYSMPKDFSEYLSKASGMCNLNMSARVKHNIEVSLAGLIFFQNFMNDLGLDFEIDCDWFENIVVEQDVNVTIIDTFITDITSIIARDRELSPFTFKVDTKTNILWIHFTSVYNYWREKYARHQTGSHSAKSIKTQLKERMVTDGNVGDPQNYVVPPQTISINGVSWHCYGINISEAQKSGLDIPKVLSTNLAVSIKKPKKSK